MAAARVPGVFVFVRWRGAGFCARFWRGLAAVRAMSAVRTVHEEVSANHQANKAVVYGCADRDVEDEDGDQRRDQSKP